MKRVLTIFILFPLLLSSCGDQKIDTTAARKEMEAREIKVVSDAQIIEQAMKLGNEVSKQLKVSLSKTEYFIELGKDTTYQRNYYLFARPNELEGKELQLFQAYNYNRKNGISSNPNIQKLDDGKTLLYTKPMTFGDSTIGMWSIRFSRKEIVLSIDN
ncbi:MAG: hypothetical protein HWE21_10295 [Cytophagia bacterium]|nr:hypothetical protein [Cytophagia bacterium]